MIGREFEFHHRTFPAMSKHVIVIPERYCLGDTITFKVRRVPSILCDRLTVCCPPAWEFLYPTATDFVHVSERLDGRGERAILGSLNALYPQAELVKVGRELRLMEDFQIVLPATHAPYSDVMVAPRRKPLSSVHRDWEGWPYFVASLRGHGLKVLAAGRRDMSEDCGVPLIEKLDEIAVAMQRTKFVISTDSGLAHLAILLRVPLIVLWGTPVGVIPGQEYRQGCHQVMEAQKRAPVHHIEGAWEDLQLAISETLRIIS